MKLLLTWYSKLLLQRSRLWNSDLKVVYVELGRWLLQGVQVQFPAPVAWGSKSPAAPVPRIPTPSGLHEYLPPCEHIHTETHIHLIKITNRVWRNSSASENTGYSSEGSEFNSQHSTWWLTITCNYSSRKLEAFLWSPRALGMHLIHRHTRRQNTHIPKTKINLYKIMLNN